MFEHWGGKTGWAPGGEWRGGKRLVEKAKGFGEAKDEGKFNICFFWRR